jgi:alkyl hydroperoxide reductase subunit AhpC
MPPLRIGSDAPDFQADTTIGSINFHDYVRNSWSILFAHPQDYTPVCATELGALAKLEPEFTRRGVKLLGLSANGLADHEGRVKDIAEVTGGTVKFPIIADPYRKVAALYDM